MENKTELSLDLTSKEGYSKARKILNKYWGIIFPLPWLIYKISPTFRQKKDVIKLVKKGKNLGFKKIRINVSHEAGINLGSDVKGIPIKAKVGNSGNMEIEVEYK